MRILILMIAFIMSLFSVGLASTGPDRDTLFQGSTIEALLAGNYDGVDTVKMTKRKGTLGLGTFAKLDGEMIVVDGKVYKVAKNGEVTLQGDNVQTPFYAVTFFDTDISKTIKGSDINLTKLKQEIDTLRSRNDLPYAIMIKGTFKSIKLRSVGPYEQPYPLLSDAIKEQNVFEYSDISGRLVGFWMPSYMGNTNATGYHLHFISDDFKKGGHVLDLMIEEGLINLDETGKMQITFSPYNTKPLEKPDKYQ